MLTTLRAGSRFDKLLGHEQEEYIKSYVMDPDARDALGVRAVAPATVQFARKGEVKMKVVA